MKSESETLGSTFIAAILLTRSASRAETAVLEAIAATDGDAMFSGELLRETVAAAIALDDVRPACGLESAARTSSMLPLELRPVLKLAANLRRCFVLRILAGIPGEVCAKLLRLDSAQIDQFARQAAQRLADLAQPQYVGLCNAEPTNLMTVV